MKSLKKVIRFSIRKLIFCRNNETILDCIQRHKYKILSILYRKTFSLEELKKILIDLGIENGDKLCVQSSWRSLVGFNGSPEELVEMLIELVGDDGVIMMPTYSGNQEYLDVQKSPSVLGVITEKFRVTKNSKRSLNAYFPINVIGRESDEYIRNHINSKSPFDENSPIYKLAENEGKLLFIGLGKYPHKVSYIHVFATLQAKIDDFYNDCYKKKIATQIKNNDIIMDRELVVRQDGYSNNRKNIKNIMRLTNHTSKRIGVTHVYLCNIVDLNNEMLNYDQTKGKIYKYKKGK